MSRLSPAEIFDRASALRALASPCRLCPHECRVDRVGGETGRCRLGPHAVLAAATAHFGEEPEVSGTRGSGTLFFGACNLRCRYCQNHQISQGAGVRRALGTPPDEIARSAVRLQGLGCHNINWVTPSHVTPWATEAHALAVAGGLALPLVYNTSAYDSVEALRLLDGVVDVYLPDLRYSDDDTAWRLSRAEGYVTAARAALVEMARQVGVDHSVATDGTIRRGLIVRLLVLPNDLAGLRESLAFLRDALGTRLRLALMSQYYPAHRARTDPLLSRPLHYGEYHRAISLVERMGFEDALIQDPVASDFYRPDFDRGSEEPFADSPRVRTVPGSSGR